MTAHHNEIKLVTDQNKKFEIRTEQRVIPKVRKIRHLTDQKKKLIQISSLKGDISIPRSQSASKTLPSILLIWGTHRTKISWKSIPVVTVVNCSMLSHLRTSMRYKILEFHRQIGRDAKPFRLVPKTEYFPIKALLTVSHRRKENLTRDLIQSRRKAPMQTLGRNKASNSVRYPSLMIFPLSSTSNMHKNIMMTILRQNLTFHSRSKAEWTLSKPNMRFLEYRRILRVFIIRWSKKTVNKTLLAA